MSAARIAAAPAGAATDHLVHAIEAAAAQHRIPFGRVARLLPHIAVEAACFAAPAGDRAAIREAGRRFAEAVAAAGGR